MSKYQKSTAKERKEESRKSIIYKFQALFSHTRKAKQQVKHGLKKKTTGSASQYYRRLKNNKLKRRRHRKLVRAQRQGRRI